jgi:hypothetical protein
MGLSRKTSKKRGKSWKSEMERWQSRQYGMVRSYISAKNDRIVCNGFYQKALTWLLSTWQQKRKSPKSLNPDWR